AGAVNDASEDVASQLVRAEQVMRTWSDARSRRIQGQRVVDREDVGEDGGDEDDSQPDDRDDQEDVDPAAAARDNLGLAVGLDLRRERELGCELRLFNGGSWDGGRSRRRRRGS